MKRQAKGPRRGEDKKALPGACAVQLSSGPLRSESEVPGHGQQGRPGYEAGLNEKYFVAT
ncbi:MAG: hypothetical protein JW846_10645 [Dehalococcoidia bacterium]|nr:hypothetical protein [Dehalococcoidia bacterium]